MKKHTSPNSAIIHVCQKLHQKNFISAYGGNVSLRIANKVIITPTKYSLAELTEDDLVVIDMHGNSLFGMNAPSSETALHLKIYENRLDVNGIIHTHPPASTAFAYVNRPIVPINPESMVYIKTIPIVPYYPVGSKELAEAVGEHIYGNNVLLLAKHGLVAAGEDLYQAYNLTELAEETAMMNMYVKLLGG